MQKNKGIEIKKKVGRGMFAETRQMIIKQWLLILKVNEQKIPWISEQLITDYYKAM